jgi:hypothetical protein
MLKKVYKFRYTNFLLVFSDVEPDQKTTRETVKVEDDLAYYNI